MKLISFFIGTDALLISRWNFPCRLHRRLYQIYFRIRTWALDFFVDEYWVPHADLEYELRSAGITKPIKIRKLDLKYREKIEKIEHDTFNILFYWHGDRGNAKLWRWIYGYDVFLEIKRRLGEKVYWVVVNGEAPMVAVFPVVDFYLRVNRHDGYSRLIDECGIQEIPYYWSRTEPDAEEAIAGIKAEIYLKANGGSERHAKELLDLLREKQLDYGRPMSVEEYSTMTYLSHKLGRKMGSPEEAKK